MPHIKAPGAMSTAKKQKLVLEKFEEYANISRACRAAKIHRKTFYNWMKDVGEGTEKHKSAFKVRYEESLPIALGVLEDEATRRAFEGVLEPVFQGGKLVGKVRKYSDTLTIVLLKAHAPEKYKERGAMELGGPGGKAIQHNVQHNVNFHDYSGKLAKTKKPDADQAG